MRRRRRSDTLVVDYPAFTQPSGWAIDKPALVVADLSSTFGFPSDVGGGIHAQFDTLDSGGYIEFPATVDRNQPFSFGALIEFHGPVRTAYVKLEDPTDTSFRGLTVSIGDTNSRIETGSSAMFILDDPGIGNRLWLGMSWFPSGDACCWMVPAPHGALAGTYTFQGPPVLDQIARRVKTFSGGNGQSWANLTRMRIGTSSDTQKIIGVFARQGDIRGGPAVMMPTINLDPTGVVRVPKYKHSVDGPRDLIVIFHGAGSDEGLGSTNSGGDLGVAVASLVEAGYATAYIRGTTDPLDYTGPNPSNWGNPHTLQTWHKPFITEIVQRYEIRNIYLLGLSMGLLNALNYYWLYPSKVKAIAGISGVSNLTHAWTSEGFAALIGAAYSTANVADVAGFDPTLNPSRYAAMPVKMWMGSADATVDPVAQVTPFKNAVNAITPGDVASVSVVGADHLVPTMFDGAALLAYFQAHV